VLKDVHRILVIKLRAIGDVVLETAVLPNLRSAFPRARIVFLTGPPAAEVVIGNPCIDAVMIAPRSGGWKKDWAFLRLLRAQGFDLVFDLFGNPRSALMTLVSGARYRIGYAFRGRKYAYNLRVPPRGHLVHEVEFNLDSLRAIGVPILERRIHFPLDESSRQFAAAFFWEQKLQDALVVAVNASGGWITKRWPLGNFAKLADRLVRDYGAKVLLSWGPGEREDIEQLRSLMIEEAVVIPPTSLKQLAAILERCDLVVSNDSGPMHIAAAVGTPVVGIYGPTNPWLQGPVGEGHHIVRKESLACLICNRVQCPYSHLACMNTLTVEEVFAAVGQCIDRNRLLKQSGVERAGTPLGSVQ